MSMTTNRLAERMTPTEIAFDTAITALYARFNNLPHTTTRERQVRAAIAKLHDRLLEKSGMDGLALGGID